MAHPTEDLVSEREFLRLAAWFLAGRGGLLQGCAVIDGWGDDTLNYVGMKDNAGEMKLVIEEWRCRL